MLEAKGRARGYHAPHLQTPLGNQMLFAQRHQFALLASHIFLVAAGIGGFASPALSAPVCSSQTPLQGKCEIALSALHPTQSAIGLIQVEERVDRMRGRPDLIRAAATRPVPVVQAPDGSFYLTDGHHQASVLYRLGARTTSAKLIGRFKDTASFWQQMQDHHWVYLYDPHGRPISPAQLPKRIADLADDPYRSLASYAEQAGYIARTDVYFMEFEWARYFGARMDWQPVDKLNLLWALQKAERLACAPEAKGLPGYTGPCMEKR